MVPVLGSRIRAAFATMAAVLQPPERLAVGARERLSPRLAMLAHDHPLVPSETAPQRALSEIGLLQGPLATVHPPVQPGIVQPRAPLGIALLLGPGVAALPPARVQTGRQGEALRPSTSRKPGRHQDKPALAPPVRPRVEASQVHSVHRAARLET